MKNEESNIQFEEALQRYQKRVEEERLSRSPVQMAFKCFGLIDDQRIELGVILASSRREAIQKSEQLLIQQGTREAFTSISCD